MRKNIIILLVIVGLVTACSIGKKEVVKKELSDDLIIHYQSRSNFGLEDAPYYEINVYADKYITYGYSNLDGFYQADLTDEQYQEIVDYVQSDKFLNLDSNLTDSSVTDGSTSYITIYYKNGLMFKIGGSNVTNKTYLGLIELLQKYKN